MKSTYKKVSLLVLVFAFFASPLFSQNSQVFWSKISKDKTAKKNKLSKETEPSKADYYQLDITKLKATLEKTPNRSFTKEESSIIVEFPNSEGHFDPFRVTEASVLEPAYQEKHPNLRSYVGQSVKDPSATIRFSVTPSGLHSMLISPQKEAQFIDTYDQNNNYIVYRESDLPASKKGFECYFEDLSAEAKKIDEQSKSLLNANDGQLRTFKLALAGTAEYSEYHWSKDLQASDTDAAKKAKVLEAMVATITRVNAIYERELSLTMVLVDNSNIIFLDAATDGYTNNNAGAMLSENQEIVDAAIGNANYDIGHVFTTSGGGVAFLRSPCDTRFKARGVSGTRSPEPNGGYVNLIAHEMGHQYGSPHTFNGSIGNCSTSNRSENSAYEPGSGTTIMSYAGICGSQNVQNRSDTYFHQHSLKLMWDNISTGRSNCAALSAISNNAPTANAGPDYTIPISTAYKLVGNSTDPDGTSAHTYTWEQYDLGPAGVPTETTVQGPLVRSYPETNDSVRYIPNFSDYVASGGSTQWEKLVSVNREINFALTVRDNNNGAQNAVDFMKVTVNSVDPFTVKTPLIWSSQSMQTIEWEVGQTADVSTINCQTVNIKLSTDGGLTFPTTIASNVANSGSFSYTVSDTLPEVDNARILIEAADNIFYDICDNDFSITKNTNPEFFIVEEILDPIDCGANTATYRFEYVTINDFSENTVFSASEIPGNNSNVTFSPTSLNASGSVTMTLSNLGNVTKGNYAIRITGTSASITKNEDIAFPFYKGFCPSVGNTRFNTSTTLVNFNTISNTSAKPSGYSDYSNTISTDVKRDNAYDLTINVNTDSSNSTFTKVWIDWNQNCDFNDPGEIYDLGKATGQTNGPTENSPLSIAIPNNAVLGSTLMRVSTKWEGDPTLCENSFDGEVEDYTINVQATLAIEEFGFDSFSVYPNPNKGDFTIKLNSSESSKINVEVYDIRGRVIYKNIYKESGDFSEKINLNHINSGMYILTVSDGLRKSTKKIIVE